MFGVDSLPFLATDYDQAWKLWQASRPVIEKLLEKQRLKVLYAVAWPPQGFYSKFDVTTGGDLKGLKLRAYNPLQHRITSYNVCYTKLLRAFGPELVCLAIAPAPPSFLRALRVARLLKIARYSPAFRLVFDALRACYRELLVALSMSTALWYLVITSYSIHYTKLYESLGIILCTKL